MTARTREDYEQTLFRDIKDLPESELGKVLKMIHFLKEEIFGTENAKQEDLERFWQSFGSWKDDRAAEEIIQDVYESRKSAARAIEL
jgi:hypothetical protein